MAGPALGGRRRLTVSRLFGVDRSGPEPPQTRTGQPLRPWTLPNAIGFVRLALVPAFLAVALTSGDGKSPAGAALFAIAAVGDYADGIAARVTGQYSRLGALMDPVTDRLLVICGVAVVLAFGLLPYWAVGLLVAREAFMLGLARYGLAHGFDLHINWPGRFAVGPVTFALFLSMVGGLRTVADVFLYLGLAAALLATALYVRDGVRHRRGAQSAAGDAPGEGSPAHAGDAGSPAHAGDDESPSSSA